MTFDLLNGNSVTIDAFQDKVWLTVRARGGGVTVAIEPTVAEELGLTGYQLARRLRRKR